ncbi:MAG: utilization substance protein [Dehalococcoidia bacterium]|nr:utilization substance protein [Dehalococcoidia bacterium]
MKNDFLLAITQLAAEKNLPKEVILSAVEAALVSAFKRDSEIVGHDFYVKIDQASGAVSVFSKKSVVETVSDPKSEVSLDEIKKLNPNAEIGDTFDVETTPQNAGRIAAQTAKQVVTQRLREAERDLVFAEFSDREGEVLSAVVQRIEPKQVILDVGRTEAVLPLPEQVRNERYRVGLRIKVYLLEVHKGTKGPQVTVSRTHRNLLRRLFELEVPEIFNGTVEIKAIAREPGFRSKVAVAARQDGVDPVGSCVGLRGIRIQNITNELNGEKIDVIQWDPDPAVFVANALSPAQAATSEINNLEKTATVVVPDRQLSLAIGKEGQNARLAARLTGWRIDIRSASAMEAEMARRAELEAEQVAAAQMALAEAVLPGKDLPAALEPPVATESPVGADEEAVAAELQEVAVALDEPIAPQLVVAPPQEITVEETGTAIHPSQAPVEAAEVSEAPAPTPVIETRPSREEMARIRFAEDIFVPAAFVPAAPGKTKGRKRKGGGRSTSTEEIAPPRAARAAKGRKNEFFSTDDDYTDP